MTENEFLERNEITERPTELETTFRDAGYASETDSTHRAKHECERIPAADDVVHVARTSLQHIGSYWSHTWRCTNCNKIAYYPPHGNRKKHILQPCDYKFCPNCGAKVEAATL